MPPKPTSKSSRKAKAISKSTKDKENLNPAAEAEDETKGIRAVVPWGKEEYFHRTDTLLTLIEEPATWHAVFGFDLGGLTSTTPTGKGKKLAQHCADIAIVFFVDGKDDLGFTTKDIKVLQGVIKH